MLSIVHVGSPGRTPPTWRVSIDAFIGRHFQFPVRTTIGDHWWIAVLDDDRLVGIAGATRDDHPEDLFLGPCGILPEARGRGMQRVLIGVREAIGVAEGFRRAVTFTNADNYASANNFIACGYRLGAPWKPFTHPEWSLFWRKQLK